MFESLLIVFREALEATLLVAIVLAYLRTTNRLRYAGAVWWGAGAGALMAAIVGAIAFWSFGGIEGNPRRLAFAGINLVAVVVLTYMLIWMREQSRGVASTMRRRIDVAVGQGSLVALWALAFFAVLREGIETALFMLTAAETATPLASVVGGLLGLAGAIAVSYLIYGGGKRVSVRAFFNVTSVLLLLFAAGLVAKTVLYLQAAGVVPSLVGPLWDLTGFQVLTSQHLVGQFLKGLFGWDPKPNLEEVMAYLGYLVVVGSAIFMSWRPGARVAREAAQPSH
ncbi:MAG: FTR1 family protein [Bacteroidetes bacterium]|nr:FTR1 family protein [Bacteroidota bacterium]MCL5025660.1 FTR1 family protein [Chloroflexota bacterium]